MARAPDQLIDGDVQFLVHVMRMSANRTVDIRKALGDGEHLGMAFDPRRDGDDARDAGRPRAHNYGIKLAGEIGKIEMAVAVDQHQLCALPSLSAYRGKTGLGAGSGVPAAIRRAPPSSRKSLSSAGTASRSSNLAADLGMNGCARIATWRITSAVT